MQCKGSSRMFHHFCKPLYKCISFYHSLHKHTHTHTFKFCVRVSISWNCCTTFYVSLLILIMTRVALNVYINLEKSRSLQSYYLIQIKFCFFMYSLSCPTEIFISFLIYMLPIYF